MLFITNRCPIQGIESKEGVEATDGRDYDFDLGENSASNSVYFCNRKKKNVNLSQEVSSFLLNNSSKLRNYQVFWHGL